MIKKFQNLTFNHVWTLLGNQEELEKIVKLEFLFNIIDY